MALTATQLTDMQADLAITTNQDVFTDAELNRLYERASDDYNGAVYLAWRQLLADANKFFDYTAGQTKVQRSQTRAHIRDMVKLWAEESRTNSNQVMIVGLAEIPPRWKDQPAEEVADRRRWNSGNWYR